MISNHYNLLIRSMLLLVLSCGLFTSSSAQQILSIADGNTAKPAPKPKPMPKSLCPDAAITSVAFLSQYTQQPLCALTEPLQLKATITNNGDVELTNVRLQSEIFDASNMTTPLATVTSDPEETLGVEGEIEIDNTTLANFTPSAVGTYTARHTVLLAEEDCDNNNDEASPTVGFQVTPEDYARDDNMIFNFIGGSSNTDREGEYFGQVYDFAVASIISSVEVCFNIEGTISGSTNGIAQTRVVLFETDENGIPTDIPITASDIYTFTGNETDNCIDFTLNAPAVAPGSYVLGVQEYSYVGVLYSSQIFTPLKTWYKSNSTSAWGAIENFNRFLAFFMRPTVECANVAGGKIGTDQEFCITDAPFDPVAFTSEIDGFAAGTLTYQWQSSTDGTNFSDISGATAATYDPDPISATTHYRRQATHTGDEEVESAFSNVVTVFALSTSVSFTAAMTTCSENGNDGVITVTVDGGDGDYLYSNDNGMTFQAANVFTNLTVGDYQIVVKGCIISEPQTVSVATCPEDPFILSLAGSTRFAEGTGGANTQTYTITRSGNTTGTASVDFILQSYGVDAADASDFTDNPFSTQTINFADGETSKTVTLNINTDSDEEVSETFLAQIQNISDGGIYENSFLIVTLEDDDAPPVGIAGVDILNTCDNPAQLGDFDLNEETDPGNGSWSIVEGTGGSFADMDNYYTTFSGTEGTRYKLEWNNGTESDQMFVSFAGDSDNDGVNDCEDRCPLFDDSIDSDMDGAPDACDCDPNNADDAMVILPDGTMMSGEIPSDMYESSGTIESTGIIKNGSDVTYKAAVSITLKAGFSVEAGGLFHAYIAPCTYNPDYQVPDFNDEEVTERFAEPTDTDVPTAFRVTAQPNPARDIVQIGFELINDTAVSMDVFNPMGERIALPMQQQTRPAGKHLHGLNVSHLPTGIYYVRVQTKDGQQVVKVMVQR